MTDRHDDLERLDQATAAIRSDRLDDGVVDAATERVWQRISTDLERPIQGCADYQLLIPALVAGRLPAARALLVEDHTRACIACRRALIARRSAALGPVAEPAPPARRGLPRRALIAAAAIAAIGLIALAAGTVGNLVAGRSLTATVDSDGGALQRIDADLTLPLDRGAVVRARQLLRTGRDASAQLRLGDGSLVEVAPRSELELRAGLRGATVELRRGNIIVHAADQGAGRLTVATADCLVAVRGTIFAVDHGLKGSRVSVIEGEVEVRRGGRRDVLAPGDQITTSQRLEPVAIADQVAWSAHAEEHAALLRELYRLQRDVADAIAPRAPRTSSRLLDLVPGDTALYLALPNLADGLDQARTVLEQRLAASPALQGWWQDRMVATGADREIFAVLDRLQPLGEPIGDEVVVALSERGFGPGAGPLALAVLDDPAAFNALLRDELARANAAAGRPVLELVDEPSDHPPSTAGLLVWVDDDLVVAAPRVEQLRAVADRVKGSGGSGFAGSELGERLAEAYREGVTWVFGLDLRVLAAAGAAGPDDAGAVLMEQLGLADATTLVVSSSRDRERRAIRAAVDFDRPRRGIAGWLADPGPIGSLDFVSPSAGFAAAAVSKDAVVIFDELLAALSGIEPEVAGELARLEQEVGIDLRADLAAPLGGEAAFALDGPVVPIPSWKLIVEVYDPEALLHTIERVVAAANRQLAAHGRPGLELGETEIGGRRYHILRRPPDPVELAFVVVDGYLVAAPDAALIEHALQYRASGVTLPRSLAFQELLPSDGNADCSAVVWRNLGTLIESIPDAALGQLPPEARVAIESSGGPGLMCVYGSSDRILATAGGDDLLSGLPLLGVGRLLGGGPRPHGEPSEPLSSPG